MWEGIFESQTYILSKSATLFPSGGCPESTSPVCTRLRETLRRFLKEIVSTGAPLLKPIQLASTSMDLLSPGRSFQPSPKNTRSSELAACIASPTFSIVTLTVPLPCCTFAPCSAFLILARSPRVTPPLFSSSSSSWRMSLSRLKKSPGAEMPALCSAAAAVPVSRTPRPLKNSSRASPRPAATVGAPAWYGCDPICIWHAGWYGCEPTWPGTAPTVTAGHAAGGC
mmetsp:Transcript_102086/g.274523  ORF Transcript_102086/g.274523 Transcript_102086/m.274523 type:complete len:226 (-) Transcript_102086:94-771(-)